MNSKEITTVSFGAFCLIEGNHVSFAGVVDFVSSGCLKWFEFIWLKIICSIHMTISQLMTASGLCTYPLAVIKTAHVTFYLN